MKVIKNISIGIGILLFFGVGFLKLFQTTDEIGFLGAGKVGRQVFIQTLDDMMEKNNKGSVDSDFFDKPFIIRFILGEPLRTTIRFNFTEEKAQETDLQMIKKWLALPHEVFTDNFGGDVAMQEGYDISPNDLRKLLVEKHVTTIEDFLAGLGFKKYEMYFQGTPMFSIELHNVKNVKHVGGD